MTSRAPITHCEQFIAQYGHRAKMKIVGGSVEVNGSLYLGGWTGLTHWGARPFRFRHVDGISVEIVHSRTAADVTIHKARWLMDIGPGKAPRPCYLVEQGGYASHGDTVAQAMRDLRFKIAQADYDPAELVNTILRRRTVRRDDFRLITGACSAGLDKGMIAAGLDPAVEELPLEVVLRAIHGPYGAAFRQALDEYA